MAADPLNPFGLPGFNPGNAATTGNPLIASLGMMQSALSSFGQSASLASDSMAQTMNPEDLEKRIAELRAVENWLKLNLSLLGSSIQGLEVQLATIKTLRTFVAMGSQQAASDDQHASPLEVVLGLKKPAAAATDNESAEPPPGEAEAVPPPAGNANAQAAKAWWDMLQGQFTQLAQATSQAAQFTQQAAASMPSQAATEPAHKTTRRAVKKSAARKSTSAKTSKKPGV